MTRGYAVPGYDMPCFDSLLTDPEARIQSFIASSPLSNPFHSWRADNMPGEPDIDGWIYRGIQPAQDIVPKTPDFMSIDRIDTYFSARDQPVIVSFNNVGKFESYKANGERYVRDFLKSPISVELINFITGKGYVNPNEIKALGVLKGNRFYAATFMRDAHVVHEGTAYHLKKGTLLFSYKVKQDVMKLAHAMGFRGESAERFAREFINSVIAHEVVHNYNELSESKIGRLLAEFYTIMAERYEGTEKGEIYRAIAQWEKAYTKRSHRKEPNPNEESELESIVDEEVTDADNVETEGLEAEISEGSEAECVDGGEAASEGSAE